MDFYKCFIFRATWSINLCPKTVAVWFTLIFKMFYVPCSMGHKFIFYKIDAVWFTLMDIKFLISLLSISVTLFLVAAVVFISLIYKNNLCTFYYRNWQDRDWNPRDLHVYPCMNI